MESTLAEIRTANKAGANPPNAGLFVVYDLPDRDCAAAASNGELSIADGGVAKYKAYIDSIRDIILEYSDVRVLLVIGKYPTYSSLPIPSSMPFSRAFTPNGAREQEGETRQLTHAPQNPTPSPT